jgi:hypothetical protein
MSSEVYWGTFQIRITRVWATRSVITSRVELVRAAIIGGLAANEAEAGMLPKYCVTLRLAVARSMSPARTSTALFGPYQLRNQPFTSSSEAASRSFIEPITL